MGRALVFDVRYVHVGGRAEALVHEEHVEGVGEECVFDEARVEGEVEER